jgi:RNA polymerase sigma-70 factor (ECF subfamily)
MRLARCSLDSRYRPEFHPGIQRHRSLLLVERSNEEWLADLSQSGPQHDEAVADLRAVLLRGLHYALSQRSNVLDSDLEDFAEDALFKILDGLPSFRGESRFTTWAHKIAVHVAFTELRRRRWRDVSLDELTQSAQGNGEFIPLFLSDPSTGPEQAAMQRAILATLRRLIREELTDKQRQAMEAILRGMPMQEVARRMHTNRNALYKLLHDARQRLQKKMLEEGLSAEEVLSAFEA